MEDNKEHNKEFNNKLYIQNSKISIETYIRKKEYRQAFSMLILVLKRLDTPDKLEFIDYYDKNLTYLIMGAYDSHFDDRSLNYDNV